LSRDKRTRLGHRWVRAQLGQMELLVIASAERPDLIAFCVVPRDSVDTTAPEAGTESPLELLVGHRGHKKAAAVSSKPKQYPGAYEIVSVREAAVGLLMEWASVFACLHHTTGTCTSCAAALSAWMRTARRLPSVVVALDLFRAGWVLLDGSQFGCDWSLYDSSPVSSHALACVVALADETAPAGIPSTRDMTLRTLRGLQRAAQGTGRNLLLAIVQPVQAQQPTAAAAASAVEERYSVRYAKVCPTHPPK
jgi:hypothetical protein